MDNFEIIEVDNYPQFIVKVNSIFNVECLDSIPKNANSYKLKMFNRREGLVNDLKNYSEFLNSYILLNGSVKDLSKDLVVMYLSEVCTDFNEIVIGGHYE